MLVTVFLLVLVFALALGNILLAFTKPGSSIKGAKAAARENPAFAGNTRQVSHAGNPGSALPDEVCSLKSSNRAVHEKVDLLNSRIDKLEGILLRINTAEFADKKLGQLNLVKKLNDLHEFKQEAKIEIAALKEILKELQEGKPQNRKAEKIPDVPGEKLHQLIYHSSK